nr:hypothetical protein [Tanacetum cinerariifolium]
MINAQVDDLSSHNTKYTSPALTQKVFANMRRIGKGYLRVKTPLFDAMLVQQQVHDDAKVQDDEDDHEVSAAPTLPSPTPATTQAQSAQPSSQPQQQPTQPTNISESSMTLLNKLMETYATLTQKVANLEQDKIAQALEITKLNMQDNDEVKPAEVEEVLKVVTAAKLMTEVVTTAAPITTVAQVPKASASMRRRGVVIQDPEETTATLVIVHSKVQFKDKGKGILIEEPKPLKGQAYIDMDEAFARQLEAELNANINWNEVIEQVKRKEQHDNEVMRYQALKRKPLTKAQARKNMVIYLKNMVGFMMDFFKGMTYNVIRPIFEMHYNSIRAFLKKGEEEVTIQEERSKRKGKSLEQEAAKKQKIDEEAEELKRHLQIVPNDDDDVYTEATPLASKVPVVDYQIHHENNKPYYKIIRADGTHKLFLSFITLLKNFDREDLEALWKLVKERFESTEPKNFSADCCLKELKGVSQGSNVFQAKD